MWASVCFWISILMLIYTYLGYPLILALIVLFKSNPVKRGDFQPFVSLIVPAYNEEGVIEEKIKNSLNIEYPRDKFEVIIASDGSTDGTNEIARGYACADERVILLKFPRNRGKISVLNDAVSKARGEIIVFSDASSMIDPKAVRNLVSHFKDESVGCVSGVYKVLKRDLSPMGKQEDLYWRYETFIKRKESQIGSTVGAHGSLYAIRKELYPYPDGATINDDYIIPMRVIRQGYRVSYEPEAVAFEEAERMEGFGRRARIGAGNYQQLKELKALIRPLKGLLLFEFISHKLLRLCSPFFLIIAFGANLILFGTAPIYRLTLSAQLLFYLSAVVFPLLGRIGVKAKFAMMPFYFILINSASLMGLYKIMRGKVVWKG